MEEVRHTGSDGNRATNVGRLKWPIAFCRELLCKVIVTLCQTQTVLLNLCNIMHL